MKQPPSDFQAKQKSLNYGEVVAKYKVANEQRMQNSKLWWRIWRFNWPTVSGRVQGTLPSDTEKNPIDQVKAVTLRNWQELEEVIKTSDDPNKEEESVL